MQQNTCFQSTARSQSNPSNQWSLPKYPKRWAGGLLAGTLLFAAFVGLGRKEFHTHEQSPFGNLPDLAMTEGDPYVRALMRTISASESNAVDPYVLLYGGDHTHDLVQHPDVCMPITVGINQGDCSTAAGRYQFLTSTWVEKASIYHPAPYYYADGSAEYNFAPEYQDKVAYYWLKDESVWSASIPDLLQQGEIEEVLKMLSGTWTSLGFGIENNSMSPHLAEIYQQVLAEELSVSGH